MFRRKTIRSMQAISIARLACLSELHEGCRHREDLMRLQDAGAISSIVFSLKLWFKSYTSPFWQRFSAVTQRMWCECNVRAECIR